MRDCENAIESYLEGKPLQTPSKILIAALVEFGNAPVRNVGTRDIARRAGVNIAAISYYFDGKDDLYAELIDQIIAYFNRMAGSFHARLDALAKNPSKQEAKALVYDYVAWRLASINGHSAAQNEVTKSIVSIVAREEINNTPMFKKIHNGVMEWSNRVFSQPFKIIYGDDVDEERSRILALALSGALIRFCVVADSIKETMRWSLIEEKECLKIRDAIFFVLDNMFRGYV